MKTILFRNYYLSEHKPESSDYGFALLPLTPEAIKLINLYLGHANSLIEQNPSLQSGLFTCPAIMFILPGLLEYHDRQQLEAKGIDLTPFDAIDADGDTTEYILLDGDWSGKFEEDECLYTSGARILIYPQIWDIQFYNMPNHESGRLISASLWLMRLNRDLGEKIFYPDSESADQPDGAKAGQKGDSTDLMPLNIRAKLPTLNSQKGDSAIAYAKFFTPNSDWTWYATEFDGEDSLYGLIQTNESEEFGYFSLSELKAARDPAGLPIERDLHFSPTPISQLRRK